jgi:hypothetical protein
MELWLIDLSPNERCLEVDNTKLSPPSLRTITLQFPQFDRELSQGNVVFCGGDFLFGSSGFELHQTSQRSGEKDIIPILLNTVKHLDTYKVEADKMMQVNQENTNQLLLFVSKHHLLQIFVEQLEAKGVDCTWRMVNDLWCRKVAESLLDHSGHNEEGGSMAVDAEVSEQGSSGRGKSVGGTRTMPLPIGLSFEKWGFKGTRWFNANNISRFNQATLYGSRFVCAGHPRELGFDFGPSLHYSQAETGINADQDIISVHNSVEEVEEGQDNGQGNSITSENTFLCLLEFNNRLWSHGNDPETSFGPGAAHTGQRSGDRIPTEGTTTIRTRDTIDPVLASLKADVKGGMPYRLIYRRLPFITDWRDLKMNRGHLVAALVGLFVRN